MHAKLSASSSKKWLNCPGSVALEKQMPQEESCYAQEGTTAHRLGEIKLQYALKKMDKVHYSKAKNVLIIEEEMEKYTDDYRDFVLEKYRKALSDSKDAIIMLEQKVDFSQWVKEGFGTSDVVIVADNHLEIIDLKYGKGVKVEAENNSQLMLYALGALDNYDWLFNISTVTMSIFQPRKDNIACFEMSAKELYDWGESIRKKAEIAYSETGECIAGAHCMEGFCRAMPICKVFSEYMLRIENSQGKKPSTLSSEELANILERVENLAKYAKGIKEYMLQQALQGVVFPGYKVVEGRKSRGYNIPDTEVIKKLSDKGYPEDIIYKKEVRTVADMEKQLKTEFKEVLGEFVTVSKGAPTLVPLEDKRPIYNSAESDFKEITV